MEFSQEHISAFNAYRAKGYSFDGLRDDQLAALREDPHIARAIVQEEQKAAATPPPRAAAAVPTLPAPDALVKGEDIDGWVERNLNCAAPIAYVSAIGDAAFKYAKDNTEKNKERNARLDALEKRIVDLEEQVMVKGIDQGVWKAGVTYRANDIVTDRNSASIAKQTTTTRPGESAHWRLLFRGHK